MIQALAVWAANLGSRHDLTDLVRVLDVVQALLRGLLGRLDAADELFSVGGAKGAVAWLRSQGVPDRVGRRMVDAARLESVSHATAAAALAGDLGAGQVEAIAANVPEALLERYRADEGDLLDRFSDASLRVTREEMCSWRRAAEAEQALGDEPGEDDPDASVGGVDGADRSEECRRALWSERQDDGTVRFEVIVPEASAEVVARAVALADGASGWDPATGFADTRSHAQRMADGLVELCHRALAWDPSPRRRRQRRQVYVNLELADLERRAGRPAGRILGAGGTVDAAALARLLDDADVHPVLRGVDGEVLHLGRAHRLVSEAQFRALSQRDGGCRFPGCDADPSWCDGHHVWPWEAGGPTDIENLVLLCGAHHNLVSRPDWHDEFHDNVYLVSNPEGRTRRSYRPARQERGERRAVPA